MKRTAASWEYMRMLKMYPDTLFQTRSNKLRLLGRKVLRNWNTKSGRGYSRHHQHTDVMNPAWGPQTKARGQWQCLQGRCEQNRENKVSAQSTNNTELFIHTKSPALPRAQLPLRPTRPYPHFCAFKFFSTRWTGTPCKSRTLWKKKARLVLSKAEFQSVLKILHYL